MQSYSSKSSNPHCWKKMTYLITNPAALPTLQKKQASVHLFYQWICFCVIALPKIIPICYSVSCSCNTCGEPFPLLTLIPQSVPAKRRKEFPPTVEATAARLLCTYHPTSDTDTAEPRMVPDLLRLPKPSSLNASAAGMLCPHAQLPLPTAMLASPVRLHTSSTVAPSPPSPLRLQQR